VPRELKIAFSSADRDCITSADRPEREGAVTRTDILVTMCVICAIGSALIAASKNRSIPATSSAAVVRVIDSC